MSLVVNHNMMAANVARNLNAHYGRLATSTQRLSTGMRVNSGADDAAGLAIRELQRADIAGLHQGARNINDAISLIQTADGALSVIDEKLIRMTELAEQAATGTYNSTQRLMIDSEFQQMASEIDRIANATDFNGVKLLDGTLSGLHDGSQLEQQGSLKIHFGTENDSAEDYYYVNIGDCTIKGLFEIKDMAIPWPGAQRIGGKYVLERQNVTAGNWGQGIDSYNIPAGLKNIRIEVINTITNAAHKPSINLFASDGTQLTGFSPDDPAYNGTLWNGMTGAQVVTGAGFDPGAVFDGTKIINRAGQTLHYNGHDISVLQDQGTLNTWEVVTVDEVADNMVFLVGGHANNSCNVYDIRIECDAPEPRLESIATQQSAQQMLEKIRGAIENKDKVRAHLGAMQNRLENSVTNISVQAENLQASESRISDTDVATEMTEFTRNQILTQAATAMLSQANTLPQMALQIVGG